MQIKECSYLGRNGYEIKDDFKKIFITNELGGRVLYYGTNETNLLHENEFNETVNIKSIEVSALKETRGDLGWNDFGGYKTWLAPQSAWDGPPYLDLDRDSYEMSYETLESGAIVVSQTSPICRETAIQIKRSYTITNNSTKMDVAHELIYHGETACSWGIWDVTQVKKPCTSIVTGELIEYEKHGEDSHVKNFINIDGDEIIAFCPANEKRGYKGYFLTDKNEFSTIFDIDSKKIMYKKEFEADKLNRYAHGSNIEVYSDFNKNYAELEVHSPLFNFAKKGESNYFTITWSFNIID